MSTSGTLVTRNYSNFKGVDFSNNEVSLYRSPDSLNMWKDYASNLGKCIETRPDLVLYQSYDNTIYGLFFYKAGDTEHVIVHCGTKLYDNGAVIFTGMNLINSQSFIYNNIFYIKDGINYLRFDGVNIKEVDGFIPTTSISREPAGGGETYQDVNLLTGLRKNSFVADGVSKDYYLDVENIDSDYSPIVIVNNKLLTEAIDFNVDSTKGKISFITAPEKPLSDGKDNVFITFRKTIQGYRDRINKATLLVVFDNRVFFSGNQNYPNAIFWSELEDPTYVSDLNYANEGMDLSSVKSMVAGNNALWVFKEPSQSNTTVFYHMPVIDSTYGKVYPSTHSSISTGCVSKGINFNDDIVFFSDRGMEAIGGDINNERLLAHRSSLVDSKLLNEINYRNLKLEEWNGYLLVVIDNKVYLADSRQMFNNADHNEYEWYYWEFGNNITCTAVKDGILYVCSNNNIYTLTNDNAQIESYWTTPLDNFKYPQYQKTTNKRGGTAEMFGESVAIDVKTDFNNFEKIGIYENSKGYIVYRIKKKKWKEIQLKFSSNKKFGLFSATLEAFVGAYVKR